MDRLARDYGVVRRPGFLHREERDFFERLGFKNYGEGLSAMNHYRNLLQNPPDSEPFVIYSALLVDGESGYGGSITVENPDNFAGALIKVYGLGKREAGAAMSYFEKTLKEGKNPKEVIRAIGSYLDREFTDARLAPASPRPHLD